MAEIWKDIPGYENLYQASTQGRIRSLTRTVTFKDGRKRTWLGQIRKLQIGKQGYHMVQLYKDNILTTFHVHYLILITFVGSRPEGKECRHLDGNRRNSCLENICWGTLSENATDKLRHGTAAQGQQHGAAKLTDDQVHQIRHLYTTGHYLMRELAKLFKVSQTAIVLIINRKRWRHLD